MILKAFTGLLGTLSDGTNLPLSTIVPVHLRIAYRNPSQPFSPTVAMVVASTSASALTCWSSLRTPSSLSSFDVATFPWRTTLSTIWRVGRRRTEKRGEGAAHDHAAGPDEALRLGEVDCVRGLVGVDEREVERRRRAHRRERVRGGADDDLGLVREAGTGEVGAGDLEERRKVSSRRAVETVWGRPERGPWRARG
jgi:hypothetical protein